jgi:hypothetical protein
MSSYILHGLNIESNISSIKIELGTNQKEVENLVKDISTLHNIFIEEFS